jgi:hypothetical protein
MAKTIKIFLTDGEPNGLKTAELSNWVGQAIVIPRVKLRESKKRPECAKPSVYFLIGKENEEDLLSSVYIGEAENLWSRLSTHDSNKSFWQTAVAFSNKDNNLTKVHVKYLESRYLKIANTTKRFEIKNGAESAIPNLSESDIADMEEFLENLKLLLSALGFPILQSIISKETPDKINPLFICSGKGAKATGRLISEGFVIYKGSTATTNNSNAVVEKNKRIIKKLVSKKYLEKKNNLYVFDKDYIFNSPSAASDLILGNSTSGWKKWKTTDSKTLEQIYKK